MTVLINIDVPDLEAGMRFYASAFGLTVGRRFSAGFIELLGWPVRLYLLAREPQTIAAGGDRRRFDRHWTPVHLDIAVENMDCAVARAVCAGAILETAPQEAAYGRIAMLADPFGHGFCLLQFNKAGYDALP